MTERTCIARVMSRAGPLPVFYVRIGIRHCFGIFNVGIGIGITDSYEILCGGRCRDSDPFTTCTSLLAIRLPCFNKLELGWTLGISSPVTCSAF